MPQSIILILKASLFEKSKTIIVNPKFMSFGTVSFSKPDIAGIRYGIKAINGYWFRIGRIYFIDIRSAAGAVIRIRFKSIYRINKNKLEQKYKIILNALFDNYINDISRKLIDKFNAKIEFSFLNVSFTQLGIILENHDKLIYWEDVGSKNYWTYYILYSIKNPADYNKFEYLSDWNVAILYSVSRHILHKKNLLQKN